MSPPRPPGRAASCRRVMAGALAAGLLAACAALTLAASPARPPARPASPWPRSARRPRWPRTRPPPSRPPAPARPPRLPRPAAARSCGLLDVSCEISNAITSWFAALARDALRPLLTLVGQTLLSSPQPGAIPAVHAMWATVAGDRRLRATCCWSSSAGSS